MSGPGVQTAIGGLGLRPVDLQGAPFRYLLPSRRPSLDEAQLWCRHLASSHYENFHVATFFLPKRIRPYFESIYAFSRVADDLGDEVPDPKTALRLLFAWRSLLDECYDEPERSTHPVFVALQATIQKTGLPKRLLIDLIEAFVRDQTVTRYETFEELIAYSKLSANPVGRMVLWVSGYTDDIRGLRSDQVCTALQLTNFLQDVVEDFERGRRYLPMQEMRRFGVTDQMIADREFCPAFRDLMIYLTDRTAALLQEGAVLPSMVDPELAVTLRLFERGGRAALDGIIAQDYDVLRARPSVSKRAKVRLLLSVLPGAIVSKAARLIGRGGSRT